MNDSTIATPMPTQQSKSHPSSLFKSLFDIRFQEFISPNILSILYVIGLIIITIGGLAGLGATMQIFSVSPGIGVLILLLVPVFWLLYVIVLRVLLELLAVLFRIAQNTTILVHQTKNE